MTIINLASVSVSHSEYVTIQLTNNSYDDGDPQINHTRSVVWYGFDGSDHEIFFASTTCGNGIIEPGEQCDDGNANNNDGCRNNCTVPVCGDNIIDIGETCDPPAQPGPNQQQPGICRQNCTYCGDGIPNNGEQCDDGNGINNNGCTNNCTLPAVTCSFDPVGTQLVQGGGTLRFWARAHNDTDDPQTFQFATKVKKPDGNWYPPSGWLFGPGTVTNLGAHTSISKYLTQFIPYNAPYGTYTYHGYVGKVSPPLLYDECTFDFEVVQ